MFKLKLIHKDAIPAALERAERYRLLNEPTQAESICHDILAIEPENERALVMLLLALTDQFEVRMGEAVKQALEVLGRFKSAYMRHYYQGIVHERQAVAQMKRHSPGAAHLAHDLLSEAMLCYEKAETLHPAGNDEAILRWNSCARLLLRHPEMKPGPHEPAAELLE